MIVTITTDASFSQQLNIGTYAFQITCDAGRFKQYGVFKKPVRKACEAEFQCILNAIYFLGMLKLENINKIVINTDSLNVIHLVKNDKVAIHRWGLKPWGKPLVGKFNNLLYKFSFSKKVDIRHLKAHQHTDTPKNWVNEWCDQKCKELLSKETEKRHQHISP